MESEKSTQQNEPIFKVANYCVAFFDLLGQRAALGNEKLLPPATNPVDLEQFSATVRRTIGSIAFMQKIAEGIIESLAPNEESALKLSLPSEAHPHWDAMQKTNVLLQRWSDGLILFSCMADENVKCSMNGIFQLFIVAGGVLSLTLAAGKPVRGAIEIAWGAELRPGELYGNAIAETYRLESEVAGFPRIVIGQEIYSYLSALEKQTGNIYAKLDAALAKRCLRMISKDNEGVYFLDYLGEGFQEAAPTPIEDRETLHSHAVAFCEEQLRSHTAVQNTKLVNRYVALLEYLRSMPPSTPPKPYAPAV